MIHLFKILPRHPASNILSMAQPETPSFSNVRYRNNYGMPARSTGLGNFPRGVSLMLPYHFPYIVEIGLLQLETVAGGIDATQA